MAGAIGAADRLYRYFTSDVDAQDKEDKKIGETLLKVLDYLAEKKFGKKFADLSNEKKRAIRIDAKAAGKEEIDSASRQMFGKPYSRLKREEKEELLRQMRDQSD